MTEDIFFQLEDASGIHLLDKKKFEETYFGLAEFIVWRMELSRLDTVPLDLTRTISLSNFNVDLENPAVRWYWVVLTKHISKNYPDLKLRFETIAAKDFYDIIIGLE